MWTRRKGACQDDEAPDVPDRPDPHAATWSSGPGSRRAILRSSARTRIDTDALQMVRRATRSHRTTVRAERQPMVADDHGPVDGSSPSPNGRPSGDIQVISRSAQILGLFATKPRMI